jgi:hypothetical protein
MRAHPTASTEDLLQRLHEAAEPVRSKYRVRRGSEESKDRSEPTRIARNARSPYDPPPATQRDLDILA